jgi:hypothetical protein
MIDVADVCCPSPYSSFAPMDYVNCDAFTMKVKINITEIGSEKCS